MTFYEGQLRLVSLDGWKSKESINLCLSRKLVILDGWKSKAYLFYGGKNLYAHDPDLKTAGQKEYGRYNCNR